jgi:hypothetical protein
MRLSPRTLAAHAAQIPTPPKKQPVFLRGDALFIAVLVILCALSWYPRRHGSLDLRWDASVYYVLGTSLAQGTGYRLLNEPGEILANQYPPMLPAIIAAHQKLVGTNDPFIVGTCLKLSFLLGFCFVVAGTYIFLRKFLSPLWARSAALLYVLNLSAHLYFNMLSAELPFTAALVLFLLVHYGMRGFRGEIAAAFAAAAAFLARTVGVVIFAAWIGDALFQRQFRRAALRSLFAALCVLPWYAYIGRVESSTDYSRPAYEYQRADYLYYNVSYARNMAYIDPFQPERGKASRSDLVKRIVSNATLIPGVIGQTVTSFRNFWVGQSASLSIRSGLGVVSPHLVDGVLILIGCCVLHGLGVLTARGEWFIGIYVFTAILAVCTTPWPAQYVRYLSPSTPVLLLGLITALRTLQDRWTDWWPSMASKARRGTLFVLALLLVEQMATYYSAHTKYLTDSPVTDKTGTPIVYKQLFYENDNVAMDECLTWIAQHARQSDIIAASMAHWVYLRTGRKAVVPPLEADAITANRLLETVPVRYIIRETPNFFAFQYVSSAIAAEPAKWRLVYVAKTDDVRVYERVLTH